MHKHIPYGLIYQQRQLVNNINVKMGTERSIVKLLKIIQNSVKHN